MFQKGIGRLIKKKKKVEENKRYGRQNLMKISQISITLNFWLWPLNICLPPVLCGQSFGKKTSETSLRKITRILISCTFHQIDLIPVSISSKIKPKPSKGKNLAARQPHALINEGDVLQHELGVGVNNLTIDAILYSAFDASELTFDPRAHTSKY